MFRSLGLLVSLLLIAGCASSTTPQEEANQATLKIQSGFQQQFDNNLFLKITAVDGVKPKRWSNTRNTFALAPGRHTVVVNGKFEYSKTSVPFTFSVRARETYAIWGRFELMSSGRVKHIYSLHDVKGRLLQRKEAVAKL